MVEGSCWEMASKSGVLGRVVIARVSTAALRGGIALYEDLKKFNRQEERTGDNMNMVPGVEAALKGGNHYLFIRRLPRFIDIPLIIMKCNTATK